MRISRFAISLTVTAVAAHIGLNYATIGSASAFWPASGIAVFLFQRYGYHSILPIWLGGLIANSQTSNAWPLMLILTGLLAIEAFLSAKIRDRLLLNKTQFFGFDDLVEYGALSFLSPFIPALLGATAICVNSRLGIYEFLTIFVTWWLGDAIGIITILPLARQFSNTSKRVQALRLNLKKWIVMIVITIITTYFLFNQSFHLSYLYILLPLIGLNFWTGGSIKGHASLATIIWIGVFQTAHFKGPLQTQITSQSLILLQFFLATLAVSTFFIIGLLKTRFSKLTLGSLMISLITSALIVEVFENNKRQTEEMRFSTQMESILKLMESKLHSYETALKSAASLIASDKSFSPQQWRDYITLLNIDKSLPGLNGMGYVLAVPHSNLSQFIQSRKSVLPEFNYHTLSDLQSVPVSTSLTEHYIISQIEPYSRNKLALGLDISSEQIRKEAADRARSENTVAITKPIVLVQDAEKKSAFVILYPIPFNKKFIGWSYAPFYFAQFLESLSKAPATSIKLELNPLRTIGYEILYQDQVVGETPGTKIDKTQWKIQSEAPLGLWGLPLTIRWYSPPGWENTYLAQSLLVAIICQVISLFAVAMIAVLRGLFQEATRLAELRTHELTMREKLWKTLMESAPVGIYQTDIQGNCIYVNKKWLELSHLTLNEALGSGWNQVLHPEDRSLILNSWARFLNGEKFELEYRFLRKDGVEVWISGLATKIKDENNRVIGYIGTVQDITALRQQQNKLLESSKMATLGEMAGGIAHEINNPLAIIIGKASIILKKMQSEDPTIRQTASLEVIPDYIKDGLLKIQITADRIAKIVRGLKTFSRSGENDPLSAFKVGPLVQSTLDLCAERLKNHGIELKVQNVPNLECFGREVQTSQVLVNLINNAHDAVIDLPQKWIELSFKELPDALEFLVTDSGGGIPAELASKIMMPFFTTKEVGKGTGLGLSVSKGLVESQGGKLWLDANSPYTCFHFTIPKNKASA